MPSPGHRPIARAATRIAAGRGCDGEMATMVRRPWPASRAIGAAGAEASAAIPYSTAPMPPARVSNPTAARTTVGSTPQRSAQPPATPATSRSELRGTRVRGNDVAGRPWSNRRTRTPIGHRGRSPNPGDHDQGHPRWCPGSRLRTVGPMNPSAPTAEPGATPDARGRPAGTATAAPSSHIAVDDDRIVGGVAGFLAGRLGVDPLWVRIGFVLLALAGRCRPRAVRRALAGAAPPTARRRGDGHGRRWGDRRRRDPADAERPSRALRRLDRWPWCCSSRVSPWRCGDRRPPSRGVSASAVAIDDRPPSSLAAPVPSPAMSTVLSRGTTPIDGRGLGHVSHAAEPSILGRATLGVAIAVAAIGALIDEANGGRLHPEQWLGAAAVVCGLGLLVGTLRGHGRWLIVPATGVRRHRVRVGNQCPTRHRCVRHVRRALGVDRSATARWPAHRPQRVRQRRRLRRRRSRRAGRGRRPGRHR